ncbi:MAG: prepilin-type N-terminal cleavage/methylation domain-containing protein [Myxococcota bacterium]
MRGQHRIRRGFTLLEVMVAVAILGLGLTAILSAQFTSVAATAHARHMSLATGLARCKMSEVEELLRIEGYPELELVESGPCCEGDNNPQFSCEWSVQKPVFPEFSAQLDLDAGLDLDSTPAGNITETAKNIDPNDPSSIGEVAGALAGGGQGEAMGGVVGLVMPFVYPSMKSIFEASARKAIVTVTWVEGDRSYDVQIVQWITKTQGLAPDLEGLASPAASGSAATPVSPNPAGGNNGPTQRGGGLFGGGAR